MCICNATQRNATQRNAYHHYILNNNFKFYIFRFFKVVNFLSAVFGFAKISSFIKESKSSCSFFYREKRTKKAASFVKRSKTTPFRIHNSVFMGLLKFIENQFAIFNYAFSCALKNQFEIISQSDYGFCYKNYFFNLNQVFRNSYDFGGRFGRNLNYGFGKDYNCNFKNNCDYGFEKNYNFGFGKNYFGNCNFGFDFGNEICGIWHDLKGFLFNRKIKKNKFMSAHSVGEGEQK